MRLSPQCCIVRFNLLFFLVSADHARNNAYLLVVLKGIKISVLYARPTTSYQRNLIA